MRNWSFAVSTLVFLLSAGQSQAQNGSEPNTASDSHTGVSLFDGLTTTERAEVLSVLNQYGFSLDDNPADKRFGELHVVNLEVFEPGWFDWLNVLHATTRPHIIEDDALWRAGDPYQVELVEETARNLRRRDTFSLVALVPVISTDPRTVDVLAITRDTWSLRPSAEFDLIDGVLTDLSATLNERNVAGLHQLIGLIFGMQQDQIELGATYHAPMFLRSRIKVTETFRLVFNRDSMELEGSANMIEATLPLYSLDSRWGFQVVEWHNITTDRTYVGDELRTYDDPHTVPVETLPFVVDQTEVDVVGQALYGFGDYPVHRFNFGYGLSSHQYLLGTEDVAPTLVAAFEQDVMPRSELASFLTVGYGGFQPEFSVLENFQSYAFSEDILIGFGAAARADLGFGWLGSDFDFLRGGLELGYTWVSEPGVGGLLDAWLGVNGRWEWADTSLYDKTIELTLHAATPILGPFRFHLFAQGQRTTDRLTESLVTLGGQNGLRGFPTGAFIGESRAVGHLEVRTLPLDVLSQYVGLVVFVDVGSAFDDDITSAILQSDVGLGVRWVFPQLRNSPIRFDYAFPLSNGRSFFPGAFTIGFEQAFGETNYVGFGNHSMR